MSWGGVEAFRSVAVMCEGNMFSVQATSRLRSWSCVGCWKEVCQHDLELELTLQVFVLSNPTCRPLQDIQASLVSAKEPHFNYSQDSSLSFQPSQTSFSVYENSTHQESSFVPFHDSWANHSRNTSSAPLAGSQRVDTASAVLQSSTSNNPNFPTYHAPLGVPVKSVGLNVEERGREKTSEQSFTQFDIAHPGEFEPASTPMKDRIGM